MNDLSEHLSSESVLRSIAVNLGVPDHVRRMHMSDNPNKIWYLVVHFYMLAFKNTK